MKTLFILNPRLKEAKKREVEKAATNYWKGDYDFVRGNIWDYDAEALADYDHFVAVGGDGTIFAAVNTMMKTWARKLTIVPAGSGNDFARSLGLKGDSVNILKSAQALEPHPMDLGKWNEHYFLNIASVGFDADVNANNNERLKRFGPFSYTLSVIKTLFTYKPRIIKKEGLALREWTLFTIGNGGYYGGGFPIFPKASPFSGELLFLGAGKSRLKHILPFLLCLFMGKDYLWKKDMVRASLRFMDFTLMDEANVNLDGENFREKGPVHVEILPKEILYVGPVNK